MPDEEFVQESFDFEMEEEETPEPEVESFLADEPLFSVLLRDVVTKLWPDDAVMRDFVTWVAAPLSEQFGHVAAKGGAFVAEREAAGLKVEARYTQDQTMRAHLINGLFPVLHVARTLQAWEAPQFRYYDDEVRRLFIAGYILHDYLKLPGVEEQLENAGFSHAKAIGPEQIPLTEAIFQAWCGTLGLDAFLAPVGGVGHVLHDLIYIAVNTQKRWGTLHNLSALPHLTLSPAQLELATQLSSLADYLTYVAWTPQAAASHPTIRRELAQLSHRMARLTYHHVADNRGVLTNFIQAAALEAMRDTYRVPLLYAPSGVVYLERREKAPPLPGVNTVIEQIVERIKKAVGERLATSLEGFGRAGKGLKYADYYWLFFELDEFIALGPAAAFKIIHFNKKPSAGRRIAKLHDQGWLGPDVDLDLPDDVRVDQLAEWAYLAEKQIREKSPDFDTAGFLLGEMGLNDILEVFEAVPRDNRAGGVGYHWYFAAGHYLKRHPGLDPAAWEGRVQDFARRLVEAIQAAQPETNETTQDAWADLKAYIADTLALGDTREQNRGTFAAELERYSNAKRRGRGTTQMCSLCSSPYTVEKQKEAAVLFAPQVYSNKLPLHGTNALRDICSICGLEMMLRQNLMVRSTASGGRFEGRRVRYLYFYPTYFFTPETLEIVRRIQNRLQRLSFTELRRQLVDKDGTVTLEPTIWQRLEPLLLIPESEFDPENDRYIRLHFPEQEPMTFCFLGVPPPGRDAKDAAAWVHPAFLALLLPLCLDVKVIASESSIPPALEADEFPETVFLDAPHAAIRYLTGGQLRVNVDNVLPALQRLATAYLVHLDANTTPGGSDFYRWQDLPALARALEETPLYLFHYLKKWQRKQKLDTLPLNKVRQYLTYFEYLKNGGNAMSHARELTNQYWKFYRASPRSMSAHNILRPISIAARVVLDADPRLFDREGLVEAVYGELHGRIESVKERKLFYFPKGSTAPERDIAMREFADYFVNQIFYEALGGDKSALRGKQLNLLKNACEVLYREAYALERAARDATEVEAEV